MKYQLRQVLKRWPSWIRYLGFLDFSRTIPKSIKEHKHDKKNVKLTPYFFYEKIQIQIFEKTACQKWLPW